MKAFMMRMVVGFILLAPIFVNIDILGQTPIDKGRTPDPLDKKDVPNVVLQNFTKDFPTVITDKWFGYPDNGKEWYEYSPDKVGGAPKYFLVEFTLDKTFYRALYASSGERITTYRNLRTDLPKDILIALNKGVYKKWKIVGEKEEIWRDLDNRKVYKVIIENAGERRTLYFESDGTILKEKEKS